MRLHRSMFTAGVAIIIAVGALPCRAAKIEALLSNTAVVKKTERQDIERGFVATPLPKMLDSVYLDRAELVLTVSTAPDSTEPLLIAVFPATEPLDTRPTAWPEDWSVMSGGFDADYCGLASISETETAVEIRLDITVMVERWLKGDGANYGLVLRSISENKSTFSWKRDGRYDGGDAKLVIYYSPLK